MGKVGEEKWIRERRKNELSKEKLNLKNGKKISFMHEMEYNFSNSKFASKEILFISRKS
ncbi:hypothetical protein HQ656_12425 [Enterococcus faecium]|nr:hypothetical protein [Enterococcus faecium]